MKIAYKFEKVETLLELSNMKNAGKIKRCAGTRFKYELCVIPEKKNKGHVYLQYSILAKKGQDAIATFLDYQGTYVYCTKSRGDSIAVDNIESLEDKFSKQNEQCFYGPLCKEHGKNHFEMLGFATKLKQHFDILQRAKMRSLIEHLIEYGYTLSTCHPLHQKELYLHVKEKLLNIYDFLTLP